MVVIFCNRMVWVTERDIFFFTCWIRCFFLLIYPTFGVSSWCALQKFFLSLFFLVACVRAWIGHLTHLNQSVGETMDDTAPGEACPTQTTIMQNEKKKISVSVNYWNTLTHTTPPYDFFSFFQQSKKFLTNYKIALKSPPCFIFFILLFFLLFYINQLTFYNSIN